MCYQSYSANCRMKKPTLAKCSIAEVHHFTFAFIRSYCVPAISVHITIMRQSSAFVNICKKTKSDETRIFKVCFGKLYDFYYMIEQHFWPVGPQRSCTWNAKCYRKLFGFIYMSSFSKTCPPLHNSKKHFRTLTFKIAKYLLSAIDQ